MLYFNSSVLVIKYSFSYEQYEQVRDYHGNGMWRGWNMNILFSCLKSFSVRSSLLVSPGINSSKPYSPLSYHFSSMKLFYSSQILASVVSPTYFLLSLLCMPISIFPLWFYQGYRKGTTNPVDASKLITHLNFRVILDNSSPISVLTTVRSLEKEKQEPLPQLTAYASWVLAKHQMVKYQMNGNKLDQ